MSRYILVFVILLSIGCTNLGRVNPNELISEGEVVYLLGLKQDNFRINLFPGSINEKNMFFQDAFGRSSFIGVSKDGYVIAKAKANSTIGLMEIRKVTSEHELRGDIFRPCHKTQNTLTAKLPSHGVVYLTDVSYEVEHGILKATYKDNYEKAVSYARKFFNDDSIVVKNIDHSFSYYSGPCSDESPMIIFY